MFLFIGVRNYFGAVQEVKPIMNRNVRVCEGCGGSWRRLQQISEFGVCLDRESGATSAGLSVVGAVDVGRRRLQEFVKNNGGLVFLSFCKQYSAPILVMEDIKDAGQQHISDVYVIREIFIMGE